jgi:hypothetical protein
MSSKNLVSKFKGKYILRKGQFWRQDPLPTYSYDLYSGINYYT